MKKLNFLINFVILFFLYGVACAYNPATGLLHEDVKTVVSLLRSTYHQDSKSSLPGWSLEHSLDTCELTGGRIWKNDDKKIFIIACFGEKSLLITNNDPVEATTYHLRGKIGKQYSEKESYLYENLIRKMNLSNIDEYEYFFTGYGIGGSIAILSAARLISMHNLCENQVKVVNFSSLKLGDEDFIKSLYERISICNILNFYRHLDLDFEVNKSYIGVPIEIMAMEGVIEKISNVKKFSWCALQIGAVGLGCFMFYNATHDYKSTHLLLVGASSILLGGYSFFTSTDIPSDDVIIHSFSYMQSRARAGTDVSNAGRIWITGSRS